MTGILVGLLLANAVFNAIVWPAFYRRVAADPRAHDDDKATKFLVVHVVLIAVALALAAASVIAAVAALLS